jgi:rubrerythrin
MLGWLHDLEDEFNSGKLERKDYENQKNELEIEALKILDQKKTITLTNENSEEKSVEEMIQNRRLERVERSAGFCVKCGMPLQKSDQFCPSCGTKCN